MQEQLAQLQGIVTSLLVRPRREEDDVDCYGGHSSEASSAYGDRNGDGGCCRTVRSVEMEQKRARLRRQVSSCHAVSPRNLARDDGEASLPTRLISSSSTFVLSAGEGLLVDDDDDGDGDEKEWEPPLTMYAYCIYWISCSDDLLNLREAWYLVLMLACQVTLIFSFSVSMSLKALRTHMDTFYDSSVKELECLYWPMTFHHRPYLFIASVAASTVVVLCYMKVKDRDTMLTWHLEPRSRCAKWLISYAWFIQAIWLPCMFCGCTANLLWSSETTNSVIMNSVSLAFLLELDGYMFAAFISDENKAAYIKDSSMAHKSIDFSDVHSAEWSLYRLAIMQCLVLSAAFHCLNWYSVQGLMYDWSLWLTSLVYMLVYAIRASVVQCMRADDVTGETFVMSRSGLSPVWSSILGISHFVAMMLVWAPKTLYPPLSVACAQHFQGPPPVG